MLAAITAVTVKLGKKKTAYSLKVLGGVTENVLPEGKDSASDPSKKGNITFQVQGGSSWGCACTMKARYKVGAGGGTEVTWSVKPDDPLDDDRVRLIAKDVRMEQVYIVTFVEAGRPDEHKAK